MRLLEAACVVYIVVKGDRRINVMCLCVVVKMNGVLVDDHLLSSAPCFAVALSSSLLWVGGNGYINVTCLVNWPFSLYFNQIARHTASLLRT